MDPDNNSCEVRLLRLLLRLRPVTVAGNAVR